MLTENSLRLWLFGPPSLYMRDKNWCWDGLLLLSHLKCWVMNKYTCTSARVMFS